MPGTAPFDPAVAAQAAAQNDLVQRKVSMDALRRRLGDTQTKDEKLRESCEGFESVFLQKLWEQMRKSVPKEGYLHSKDEESYQSLFDVELCKKMASAGGIGLADMLYDQLSQQLDRTASATTGAGRTALLADVKIPAGPPAQSVNTPAGPLTAESLYTDLPEETAEAAAETAAPAAPKAEDDDIVQFALRELEAEMAAQSGGSSAQAGQAEQVKASPVPPDARQAFLQPAAEAVAESDEKKNQGIAATSWLANNQVSAKPKPVNIFSRNRNTAGKNERAAKAETDREPARTGMAPQETQWPLEGKILSGFGWEDDPAGGPRRWNPGVTIAAATGDGVKAALPGTVIFSGPREGFGNTVVLEHADGYRSYYGNVETEGLNPGDSVPAGTIFAKVAPNSPLLPAGAGGGANSSALHFEFKRGEMALNPESAVRRFVAAGR